MPIARGNTAHLQSVQRISDQNLAFVCWVATSDVPLRRIVARLQSAQHNARLQSVQYNARLDSVQYNARLDSVQHNFDHNLAFDGWVARD